MTWTTSIANSAGSPNRCGNGTESGDPRVQVLLHLEQGRGAEQPRSDADDADPERAQLARRRQDHADDAALRRRVGGLADLSFVGRHRSRRDDNPALAVPPRLQPGHVRRDQTHHVEGADQVDFDQVAEVLEGHRVPSLSTIRCGFATPTQLIRIRAAPWTSLARADRRFGGGFVGDVAGDRQRADLAGQGLDPVTVDVDHRHPGAGFGQMTGGLGTQPGGRAGHHRRAIPQIQAVLLVASHHLRSWRHHTPLTDAAKAAYANLLQTRVCRAAEPRSVGNRWLSSVLMINCNKRLLGGFRCVHPRYSPVRRSQRS